MNSHYWAISHAQDWYECDMLMEAQEAQRNAKEQASLANPANSRHTDTDWCETAPVSLDFFEMEFNTPLAHRRPLDKSNQGMETIEGELYVLQTVVEETKGEPYMDALDREALTLTKRNLYTRLHANMCKVKGCCRKEGRFIYSLETQIVAKVDKLTETMVPSMLDKAHALFMETEWVKYQSQVEDALDLCRTPEEGKMLHDCCFYWYRLLFFYDNCHESAFKRLIEEQPSFLIGDEPDTECYKELLSHFNQHDLSKAEFRELIVEALDMNLEHLIGLREDSCKHGLLCERLDLLRQIRRGNNSRVRRRGLGLGNRLLQFVVGGINQLANWFNAGLAGHVRVNPFLALVNAPVFVPVAVNPFLALVNAPEFVPMPPRHDVDNEWGLVDTRQPHIRDGSRDGDY